jgi:hypothetical protein
VRCQASLPCCHLKDYSWLVALKPPLREKAKRHRWCSQHLQRGKRVEAVESFGELSLREVVMFALGEVGLSKQTEIQLVDVTSGVLGSHTGSRMTFFYLLLVCCSGASFFSMAYMHCITSYRSTFVSMRRKGSSLDALGKISSFDKVIYSISSM